MDTVRLPVDGLLLFVIINAINLKISKTYRNINLFIYLFTSEEIFEV